jgi:hypothetical protein
MLNGLIYSVLKPMIFSRMISIFDFLLYYFFLYKALVFMLGESWGFKDERLFEFLNKELSRTLEEDIELYIVLLRLDSFSIRFLESCKLFFALSNELVFSLSVRKETLWQFSIGFYFNQFGYYNKQKCNTGFIL